MHPSWTCSILCHRYFLFLPRHLILLAPKLSQFFNLDNAVLTLVTQDKPEINGLLQFYFMIRAKLMRFPTIIQNIALTTKYFLIIYLVDYKFIYKTNETSLWWYFEHILIFLLKNSILTPSLSHYTWLISIFWASKNYRMQNIFLNIHN